MKSYEKSRIFWLSLIAGALNAGLVAAAAGDGLPAGVKVTLSSLAATASFVAVALRVDDSRKGGR